MLAESTVLLHTSGEKVVPLQPRPSAHFVTKPNHPADFLIDIGPTEQLTCAEGTDDTWKQICSASVKEDTYGQYTPSLPPPSVPPFPCRLQPLCTSANRICDDHRRVLFVKFIPDSGLHTIEIPFGKWEDWDWYYDRVAERISVSKDRLSLVFAGATRPATACRHSGLQLSPRCIASSRPTRLPAIYQCVQVKIRWPYRRHQLQLWQEVAWMILLGLHLLPHGHLQFREC